MTEARYELINWFDARSDDGWTALDDLDLSLASITTMGRVIHDTEDVLCVASSVESRTGQLSGIMWIPKVCIAKRTVLMKGISPEPILPD